MGKSFQEPCLSHKKPVKRRRIPQARLFFYFFNEWWIRLIGYLRVDTGSAIHLWENVDDLGQVTSDSWVPNGKHLAVGLNNSHS